jgi:hypothetical protein
MTQMQTLLFMWIVFGSVCTGICLGVWWMGKR